MSNVCVSMPSFCRVFFTEQTAPIYFTHPYYFMSFSSRFGGRKQNLYQDLTEKGLSATSPHYSRYLWICIPCYEIYKLSNGTHRHKYICKNNKFSRGFMQLSRAVHLRARHRKHLLPLESYTVWIWNKQHGHLHFGILTFFCKVLLLPSTISALLRLPIRT